MVQESERQIFQNSNKDLQCSVQERASGGELPLPGLEGRPAVRGNLADTGESYLLDISHLVRDDFKIIRPVENWDNPHFELKQSNALKDDVQQWLTDNKVHYTLDLRPTWVKHPSMITIYNSKDAMWFKLTWL
jgi:hypothetical protein